MVIDDKRRAAGGEKQDIGYLLYLITLSSV